MQGNGILKGIIEYLNAKIKAAYPFEAVYGLSDLMDGKYTHYIGNGQSEHVTNFDKYAGTIFWLRNGNATIARAQSRTDACNFDYQLTIPIRVVANLKKSLFQCDNETADDNLAMALLPIITDNGNAIKKAIGAQQLYIEPINYNVRVPSIAFNALYATVMMDFKITIVASLDCIVQDFCIDTSKIPIEIIKRICPEFFVNDEKYIDDGKVYFENGTNISIEIVDGKIVINSTGGGLTCDDLQSCQIIQDIINDLANKLETVAVDGVTITGDGTVGNPLVSHAAGGANLWAYKAKTTITTGDPTPTHLIWDNATQVSATQINLSHLTEDGFDIDLFFVYIVTGDKIIIQDRDDSANFQIWTVSGAPTIIPNSYIEIPVTLDSSGGTGTTNFANNDKLLVAKFGGVVPTLEIEQDGVSVETDTHKINVLSPLEAVSVGGNEVEFRLAASTLTGAMYELQYGTINRLAFGAVYVASENKYFISGNFDSTVRVFNATTFELLATVAVTGAIEVDYISYLNEVWTSNISNGLITRINATTNSITGTLTPPATNNAFRQYIEYLNPLIGNPRVYIISSTTNNLVIYDLVLNTFSTVSLGGSRVCLNAFLIQNPSSAMDRHLLITGLTSANTGIRIFDCEAGTFVALDVTPPTLSSSDSPYYIDYNQAQDELAVSYPNQNLVAIIKPDTTTTFTTEKKINILQPSRVIFDNNNDLLLILSIYNVSNNALFQKYDNLNYDVISALQTSLVLSPVIWISNIQLIGNTGTCIVMGRNNTGSAAGDNKVFSKIKYA